MINFSGKQLAVLIDPDSWNINYIEQLQQSIDVIDFFLIGGSLIHKGKFEEVIKDVKFRFKQKIYIFPGNGFQISSQADGILFLSLLSSRNPEYLAGIQIQAAPIIKSVGLDTLSCAYLLIEGGKISTTSYITQSLPIPIDKPDIAVSTALAAQMFGFKSVYLEAGSGALQSVPIQFIEKIKATTKLPLFSGGGVRNVNQIIELWNAGADVVVVGNALEGKTDLLKELSLLKKVNTF